MFILRTRALANTRNQITIPPVCMYGGGDYSSRSKKSLKCFLTKTIGIFVGEEDLSAPKMIFSDRIHQRKGLTEKKKFIFKCSISQIDMNKKVLFCKTGKQRKGKKKNNAKFIFLTL